MTEYWKPAYAVRALYSIADLAHAAVSPRPALHPLPLHPYNPRSPQIRPIRRFLWRSPTP